MTVFGGVGDNALKEGFGCSLTAESVGNNLAEEAQHCDIHVLGELKKKQLSKKIGDDTTIYVGENKEQIYPPPENFWQKVMRGWSNTE